MIGDGEAETGPLAGSWHGNKFLNSRTDGAVLPILHLNGYKIANPTVLARIPEGELVSLLRGYGYEPLLFTASLGDEDGPSARPVRPTLDEALDRIAAIKASGDEGRPTWPAIVFRTPKGWTGPREVDGVQVEDTWRSHQVPLAETRTNDAHRAQLEEWLRSYRPEELFDESGQLRPSSPRCARPANGG